MTAWGRARVAFVALGLAVAMFVFVFPTRSYLAQRHRIDSTRNDVAVLREQNAKLAAESQRLGSKEEIERMAREQFGMAYPGEQVYRVLPAPAGPDAATTTTTTTAVP